MKKWNILLITGVLVFVVVTAFYFAVANKRSKITTFEECEKAGLLIYSIKIYDGTGIIEKECMLWGGKTYIKERPVIIPDIPAPKGWIGGRDGNSNHFVFIENREGLEDGFNPAQIIVDARRMDRPLEEWVKGYIDNNPAFEHTPFDPLQTWSSIEGRIVLVTERKPTSFLTFHVFDKGVVYEFWFTPFARWGKQGPAYNTEDLKIVQSMIFEFVSRL